MSATRTAFDTLIEARTEMDGEIQRFYKNDIVITSCSYSFIQQSESLQKTATQLTMAWDNFKQTSKISPKEPFIFQLEVKQELQELELTGIQFDKLYDIIHTLAANTPIGAQQRKIAEPSPPMLNIPMSWAQLAETQRALYIHTVSFKNLTHQTKLFNPSHYTNTFLAQKTHEPSQDTPTHTPLTPQSTL